MIEGERKEEKIISTDILSNFITQSLASQRSWTRFQENRQRDWGLIGQDWGIHDLNITTGGILPKKITTLAGLPSHGKTALINPIVEGSSRWKEVGVTIKPELCIFTWEMEPSELVDRFVSAKTGLSSQQLMLGAKLLTEKQISSIKKALEDVRQIPIHYHEKSLDIEKLLGVYYEFVAYCKNLEKQDGIQRQPIAILDYVGLADFDSGGIRTYGINDFYKKLKQVVNETDGHFIIFAQLDKSARNKEYPDLNDLADSQAIERNSDNVILIHRPEHIGNSSVVHPRTKETYHSENKMIVRVPKCRGFSTNDFILNCDLARNRFWSIKQDEDFPYWELYSDEDFWKNMLLK